MSPSQRFFARTFGPFFLFTGAGTALVALYAFLPEWALVHVGKLEFVREYTIIVQHWGIMVGLMGVFMMAAALIPQWRIPMALYSGVEKAFMVWLVLANAQYPHARGFWIPFALDATVVIYTIGWFACCGFQQTSGARGAA